MYLKEIEVDRSIILIGESLNITALLTNDGTANSTGEFIRFYDGPMILENKTVIVSRNGTASLTIPWTANNISSKGLHNFRAVLGSMDKNTTILVRGIPNVIISDIEVDKKHIVVGDEVFIVSSLMNNGSADSIDLKVKFYLDDELLKTVNTNVSQGGLSTVSYEWDTKLVRPGKHTVSVVVGNSTMKKIIKIDQRPAVYLGIPLVYWTTGFIIIMVIVFTVMIGYSMRKRTKRGQRKRAKRRHR